MHPLPVLKSAMVQPLSPIQGPPLPTPGGPPHRRRARTATSCIAAPLYAGMLGLVNLMTQKTSLLLSLLFNSLLFSYLNSQRSEQQAQ